MGQYKNILLVEDEEIVALMVQSVLKKEGYEVFPCKNAQEALSLAESRKIALLIADVNLPGSVDGVALARKLREKEPLLPIILTSGSYDGTQRIHDELKALLLSKPFRKSELLEKVGQLLQPSS